MSARSFIEKIAREARRATQQGVTSIEQHNALKFIAVQADAALASLKSGER